MKKYDLISRLISAKPSNFTHFFLGFLFTMLILFGIVWSSFDRDYSSFSQEVMQIVNVFEEPTPMPITLDFSETGLILSSVRVSGATPKTITATPNFIEKEEEEFLPAIPLTFCIPENMERIVGRVVAVHGAKTLIVDFAEKKVLVEFLGIDVDDLSKDLETTLISLNLVLVGQSIVVATSDDVTKEDNLIEGYVISGDTFINYQILEWGMAKVEKDDHPCSSFYLLAEQSAQENKIGVWIPVDMRTLPSDWKSSPVIPQISNNALDIYIDGLSKGADENSFSVIGDCQSLPTKLFGRFDWDSYYLNDQHKYLQETVNKFSGNFNRWAITVADGATVASMFSVFWSNRNVCNPTESPLDCEFRLNKPSIVLVSLGTNWKFGNTQDFEKYLRKIVEYAIDHHALPILATKIDATTSDFPLNRVIAQVAYDYDIPLWNFWAAVQSLPNKGIDRTDPFGIHFLEDAYPIKRITGLEALKAVVDASVAP